jgi:hypothetical protein
MRLPPPGVDFVSCYARATGSPFLVLGKIGLKLGAGATEIGQSGQCQTGISIARNLPRPPSDGPAGVESLTALAGMRLSGAPE